MQNYTWLLQRFIIQCVIPAEGTRGASQPRESYDAITATVDLLAPDFVSNIPGFYTQKQKHSRGYFEGALFPRRVPRDTRMTAN